MQGGVALDGRWIATSREWGSGRHRKTLLREVLTINDAVALRSEAPAAKSAEGTLRPHRWILSQKPGYPRCFRLSDLAMLIHQEGETATR